MNVFILGGVCTKKCLFTAFRGARFTLNRRRARNAVWVNRGYLRYVPSKSGRLDRGWRRRAAHGVSSALRKQIVPHPEMRNLARWSGEPKRSLRARPRADICATRTPPVRGRRRQHISLPPHRQRHLHCTSARRVPARRRRRTASCGLRSSACSTTVVARRRVAVEG